MGFDHSRNSLTFRCSAFLAWMRSRECLEEKLLDEMSDYELYSDWETVGFAFLGPMEAAGISASCHSRWAEQMMQAVRDPQNGVYDAVNAGVTAFRQLAGKTKIGREAAEAVIAYLEKGLTPYEYTLLTSLTLKTDLGDRMPVTPAGKIRFGMVNPWPGGKSAEFEVIARTISAAEDAGMECVPLSNFSQILDRKTQLTTDRFADADELDFVISTHYETHKTLDLFYYHTLWNPPEIPLNLSDYDTRITNNYMMNDDFLIYDDGGMADHLRCILMDKPRTLEGASSLTASFPERCMLKPRLDNPKMFYCGMNWECVVSNSNRHQGLFKLLDETGKVKFFGPDKVKEWGGRRPWAGYKCYQYSIPFDGFSILKEINDCGICLVLSSDIHRRAGAATNRTYEACAAGAVMISDDNPFMLKYFKDAALFIQYNKRDPQDTFCQLMEKYEWVVSHKEEALKLAQRAQQIFREHFTMDGQLRKIARNHADRVRVIQRDLFAQSEKDRVAVGYVLGTLDSKEVRRRMDQVLENIRRQRYRNIVLLVAADEKIAREVQKLCDARLSTAMVFPMPLFDFKKSRSLTNCQALEAMYGQVQHDLFINTKETEHWFSDHVTTLVRTLHDGQGEAVYSGRNQIGPDHFIRPEFFGQLKLRESICSMQYPSWIPTPGQVLFSAKCHAYLKPYMHRFLDGCEHYAILAQSWLCGQIRPLFSNRLSLVYDYCATENETFYTVIPFIYQQRLINDMVKNRAGVAALDSMDNRQVMHDLAWLPLKKWLRMKWYRIVQRYVPKSTRLFRRAAEKYAESERNFMFHFNN